MKQSTRFTTQLTVRVTDMNYGGHLGNDRVLAFFHEARVRFLSALGVSEKDVGDSVSLTQTEAFVQYKGEAFLSEILLCDVWVEEFGSLRFRVRYELKRATDDKIIALGYTDLAGFDYHSRKLKRLPPSLKNKIESFQSAPAPNDGSSVNLSQKG
jgi:acyl-CoA thioester hydrolase